MNFSSQRSKILLAAGAVTAIALSVYGYMSYAGASKEDDSNLEPALTEDEIVTIMANIEDKFKAGYMQMSQYMNQIKMQYQQQGMQIDQAELTKALLPQAEKMFADAEDAVYEEFDCTAEEVEEAHRVYEARGNEKLKEITKKIKAMYKELGGVVDASSGRAVAAKGKAKGAKKETVEPAEPAEPAEGSSESMFGGGGAPSGPCTIVSVDDFIGFVEAMAGKMAQFFDGYFDAFTAEYGRLSASSSPEMQQRFQMGMVKLAEEVQQAFFVSCNMTEKQFESLLMQHQGDPRVQMAFMQLQYATQQRMQQRLAESEGVAGPGDLAPPQVEEVGSVEELDE